MAAKASLFDLEYVVFDFETTGLHPERGDEVIEMGAIKLRGDIPTGETFQSLIDIQKPVPKEASNIHGIRNEDLKGKPLLRDVLPQFIQFIGTKILIAHNAEFDLGFLKKALRSLPSFNFQNHCIDTLQLSRMLFSYEKSHNLDALANRFGFFPEEFTDQRHRSIGDCLLTAKIFGELLKSLKRKKMATLHGIRSCMLTLSKAPSSISEQSLQLFL